jgi:hypothetical protein
MDRRGSGSRLRAATLTVELADDEIVGLFEALMKGAT